MIYTVQQGVQANRACGHHFFDASAMRFFDSRVESWHPVTGGALFVTSEQFDSKSPRLFTVRRILDSGKVESVSEFQEYATLADAQSAIKTPAALS